MGNNKKTVKCGYCGKIGHNRVSCEEQKATIEENRTLYGSSHPDVKEYDEYKQDYSKKSSTNAKNTRFCSYCRTSGHNSRTCTVRSRDFTRLKKLNYKWRTAMLEELQARGIGIGSIFSSTSSSHSVNKSKSKKIWTLVSVDWGNLSWIIDNRRVFKMVLLSNPSTTKILTLEQILDKSPKHNFNNVWHVMSQSENLDFPDDWDSMSDKGFDSNCIEVFANLSKEEYDAMFMFFWDKKSIQLRFEPQTADLYLRTMGGIDE